MCSGGQRKGVGGQAGATSRQMVDRRVCGDKLWTAGMCVMSTAEHNKRQVTNVHTQRDTPITMAGFLLMTANRREPAEAPLLKYWTFGAACCPAHNTAAHHSTADSGDDRLGELQGVKPGHCFGCTASNSEGPQTSQTLRPVSPP